MLPHEESLKLKNQLCFRLYKVSRTMIRLYQPLLESLNLTYPQYITMLVMWEEGSLDFKELGRRLELKTGTLTPIVKNLETLEYLVREKNENDNRRIWVKLTTKGSELKQMALKVPELLTRHINLSSEQYFHYISELDELGNMLELAETKILREDQK